MRALSLRLVRSINVTRVVCNHLVGKEHSKRHRMIVGVVLMVVGVAVAKHAGHSDVFLVAFGGDGLGYALHGLGLTPFVESIIASFE